MLLENYCNIIASILRTDSHASLSDSEIWIFTKEHARKNEAAETCFFRTTVARRVLTNRKCADEP